VQIIKACAVYEHRLRESGTRELLNVALAAEGVPMVGARALGPQADLDGPAMMRGLQEDGIPMAATERPRERLNMRLREGETTPEEDTDREAVPTRRTVSTGDPEGTRQDCPDCPYDGRRKDGSVCPTCNGAGFITVERAREAGAARALMRLAEGASENAYESGQVPFPIKTDDPEVALAEIGRWAERAEAEGKGVRADGTLDLGRDVPMVDDGTPAEPDEADLIDLGREVPKAGPVPQRPASEILQEAEELVA
jgi:hypothetical protein